MKIIKQSWSFIDGWDLSGEKILRLIEQAGRICYKSEDKISDESHLEFVARAIGIGHHSIIEHASIPVRIITDRGVSHEIVRHRIASYSQESTRYCNYGSGKFGNEITVILPTQFYDGYDSGDFGDDSKKFLIWQQAMIDCEKHYLNMLSCGSTPQEARAVLPNSLKTEMIMTANVREFRHFFNLRCSPKAHPQMRDLAISMLNGFKEVVPVIFDDIKY